MQEGRLSRSAVRPAATSPHLTSSQGQRLTGTQMQAAMFSLYPSLIRRCTQAGISPPSAGKLATESLLWILSAVQPVHGTRTPMAPFAPCPSQAQLSTQAGTLTL